MEVLHTGLDGLDMAVRCRIPDGLDAFLTAAKEAASVCPDGRVSLSLGGLDLSVRGSGMRGGYAFSFDTGPMGAIWAMRRATSTDPFGARLSMRSLPMALTGLNAARSEVARAVGRLGLVRDQDAVSISRVDVAVDVLAPGFEIDPGALVMHSRCQRRVHTDVREILELGHSGRITSVTAGKMPGRQVIIYDKREEVLSRHKVEWPEIWNAARLARGLPSIDIADRDASRVIRVELRAGKKHLKNGWQVVGWQSLVDTLPNILSAMLDDIRYTAPGPDTNRSRWPDHPLWQTVRKAIDGLKIEGADALPSERVLVAKRSDKIMVLEQQLLGLATSLAPLEGVGCDAFDAFLASLAPRLAALSRSHREPIEMRLARAAQRHAHLAPNAE